MKKISNIVIFLNAILVLLYMSSTVLAESLGNTGHSGNPAHNNGLTCSTAIGCHTGGIPPSVVIQGPLTVKINTKNRYKITMIHNGENKVAGLNLSVDSGLLYTKDASTKAVQVVPDISSEITHTSPKLTMVDKTTVTWLFDWTAPATAGKINLYAALLSADNNGKVAGQVGETGDATTTQTIAVNVVDTLTVTSAKPVVKIIAPFTAPVGEPVALIATTSVVDGFVNEYQWSFEDALSLPKKIIGTANGEQITKSFNTPGTITIILKAISDKGEISTTFFDIEITNDITGPTSKLVPTAKITAPANSGTANTPVTFNADQSISASGKIFRYIWDYGDGVIKEEAVPTTTHTYTKPDTYTVTLAVQDLNEFTNIDSVTINIVAETAGAPVKLNGETLYNNNCQSAGCHGIGGIANGLVKNIQGSTRKLIDDSVAGVNGVDAAMMASIVTVQLSGANSTQDIATYLGSVVFPVTPLPTDIEKGKLLYEARCLLCHGATADGVVNRGLPIKGAKQSAILDAINQVVSIVPPKNAIPLMKGIQLTVAEATLIETYLQTLVPVGGIVAAGQTTFTMKCQMCHGTGTGGFAIGLMSPVAATVGTIDLALKNITMMQNINLSAVEKLDLAAFLAGPSAVPTPTTGLGLYWMYCSYCHGADGKGGQVAEKSILGKTAEDIVKAYTKENISPLMRNSNLKNVGFTINGSTGQLDLIEQFLGQNNGS